MKQLKDFTKTSPEIVSQLIEPKGDEYGGKTLDKQSCGNNISQAEDASRIYKF